MLIKFSLLLIVAAVSEARSFGEVGASCVVVHIMWHVFGPLSRWDP